MSVSFDEALKIAKKNLIHKEVVLNYCEEFLDAYSFGVYDGEGYKVDYIDDSLPIIVSKENGEVIHMMEYVSNHDDEDPIESFEF